jgi:DNA ligase-1
MSKTAGETSRGNCLLAHDWDGELDPKGWFMSIKYDGCRAIFDGKNFWSRQNAVTKKSNIFNAPDWFKQGLPEFKLDGEMYMGRKMFQKTCSAIKNGASSWKQVRYMVFDAPEIPGTFEKRMQALQEASKTWPAHVQLVEQEICQGKDHLIQRLHAEEALGGEGIMLRKPGSLYEIGRSHTILKVKNFFECEFLVVGHTAGKGKYKGMVGALECTTIAATLTVGGKTVVVPQGVHVNVGSGLTDAQRRNPFPPGTVVKGSFLELTDDNVPRNPSLIGERE